MSKVLNREAPLCAIRVFEESGLYYYELFKTFESQDEMDDYHFNDEEDDQNSLEDGSRICCLSAPWDKVKAVYEKMYVLLGDECVIDFYRNVDNMVQYLMKQVIGIFACSEDDFTPFIAGETIYVGTNEDGIGAIVEEDSEDCTSYRWVIASAKE